MSRTKRKPYTGSKAVDRTCRCHGSCLWCRGNREAALKRQVARLKDELEEWKRMCWGRVA